MSVLDMLNRPWAIMPTKLETMRTVYDRHARGDRFDADSVTAAVGKYKAAEQALQTYKLNEDGYAIIQGVAVIPVEGILAKKMDMMTFFSGGMSTQALVGSVVAAEADESVHSIIMAIASPGGEVDGTVQIGNAVASATKPTLAWVDGTAASAAFWIAAQCDSIYADSDTAQVGSIAVVWDHTDRSKANDERGIKVTHVTTGKYKRILTSNQPLSKDGEQYMQDQVDYLHTLFVNAVADGRGEDPQKVADDWAQGQMLFAQQAVDNGLIDGIASLEECIAKLVTQYQQDLKRPGAAAASGQHKTNAQGENTVENPFKIFATEADYQAHMKQAEGAAEERGRTAATMTESQKEALRAEGHAAGAKAERERIAAIEATPLAAQYPKVVDSLKADGRSGGAEAAMAILKAEADSRAGHAANAREEAHEPANASAGTPGADADKAGAAGAAKEATVQTVSALIDKEIAAQKAVGKTISATQAAANLRGRGELK